MESKHKNMLGNDKSHRPTKENFLKQHVSPVVYPLHTKFNALLLRPVLPMSVSRVQRKTGRC